MFGEDFNFIVKNYEIKVKLFKKVIFITNSINFMIKYLKENSYLDTCL